MSVAALRVMDGYLSEAIRRYPVDPDLLSSLTWAMLALAGLTIGGMLTVVINRLPIHLMLIWESEARDALELDDPEDGGAYASLFRLRSVCPECDAPVAWLDTLPLKGYLRRRGRCASCHTRISPAYPLIELASAAFVLLAGVHYGVTLQGAMIALACLALLALAVIDFRTHLLVDAITLPLLWLGLLYQVLFAPDNIAGAVIGAMVGYVSLWSLYWIFKLATGKEAMGYGDFKLLAALGAWLGWSALPVVLVIAAGAGAVLGIVLQLLIPRLRGRSMPFGPYLAVAGWIMLLAGDAVKDGYMSLVFP